VLTAARNRMATLFASGYDVINSTGKRKAASTAITHEDQQLKERDRRRLIGTGQHLQRNFSIVAWAVRKHLDYVTQFDFQMRTEDEQFNQQVERLWAEWSRPGNCDVAGRHPLPKMLRMMEARRTLDGDCFLLKRSQGRLQAIESDRIRTPDDIEPGQIWHNGALVNKDGRVQRWGVHDRIGGNRYELSRQVIASNIIQHACFERFDQVRGISPLSAAYNSFQDVSESVDFALAKMKVEQMFALVITNGSSDGYGEHTKVGDSYDVDFGKGGAVKLEMDPGDDAKFLKSDNPSTATQEFIHTVIGMAIKALDLPFNFYDESHTNFFGSRAAWLLYDRSCISKRADILELLRKLTIWRLQLWIQDGVIRLPAGTSLRDIQFEWIHRGMPWWDPAKEISGNIAAISAGLDTPQRICRSTGTDFETNVKQIAKAKALAAEHDVDLSFAIEEPTGVDDDEN